MIPAWVRVIVEALRDYYHPTRHSVLLKSYPVSKHIEVERLEPFRKQLQGRWIFVCPPISVDDSDRIAQMQYTVRAIIKPLNEVKANDPQTILKIAAVKAQYYSTIILFMFDLSKGFYKSIWDRAAYRKFLFKFWREDIGDCLKTFESILEQNSNLESFFFDIPPFNRRKVQQPNGDGWRSIGRRVWNEGWGSILEAPVLKIFSLILADAEAALLNDMEEAQRKMEENFNKGN